MAPREAAYYTALAKQAGAVAKRVRAQKLDAMCGTQSHQGVAARTASISYAQLPDILAAAAAAGSRPFWCCATAWRTLTTWVPLCARRFCAARTAW